MCTWCRRSGEDPTAGKLQPCEEQVNEGFEESGDEIGMSLGPEEVSNCPGCPIQGYIAMYRADR